MGAAFEKIGEVSSEGRVPVVVLLTDGQVGDESSVLKRLQSSLGDARVFTVGIDTAVNGGFLMRLAALGGGTSTLVEPGARLEEALQAVGREIGTALVTDLRVAGEVSEAAPARLPDLFAGRASAAFFRFGGGRVTVTGRRADGGKYEEVLEPREAPLAALDHLWARARVVDLEDEFRASRSDAVKKEIIALSVKHAVLTRFTAFVVIDSEVVNKGGKQRTVVQPVEEPADWAPQTRTMAAGRMMPMFASAGAPLPMQPMAMAPKAQMQRGAKKSLGGLMRNLIGASGVAESALDERATPSQRERVRKALEAFVQAFTQAKAAGAGASAEPLEKARMELIKALSEALAIATAVPLLQAFLRSAAVEIIGGLKACGPAGGIVDWRASELHAALEQARDPLDAPSGKSAAGSFWEASI
jgi:Ca-activated chloride channel family protein